MKAITKFLAGGVAVVALASAAPAAAQYYPGYGGYGGGNVVGAIINSVIGGGLGGGYGGYGGYSPYGYNTGVNSQAIVNQCANAVQARLAGGSNAYGYNGGYAYNGYNGYGAGRVLGISRVEQRAAGGLKVRGVATSGQAGGYNQAQINLVWKCNTDFAGRIVDIDIDPAQSNYGYSFNTNQYTPWNDYSQYGYRRY